MELKFNGKESLQKIKRAKLGTFAKLKLTPRPPSKLFGIENCIRGTNKVVGTSDPLDQTPRPPVWQMSQVLLFLFFEGFPKYHMLKVKLCISISPNKDLTSLSVQLHATTDRSGNSCLPYLQRKLTTRGFTNRFRDRGTLPLPQY